MGLINEFKAFILRGNVVEMAVGLVIGAAFGKIVSSFVADIVMPPLGLVRLTSGAASSPRRCSSAPSCSSGTSRPVRAARASAPIT